MKKYKRANTVFYLLICFSLSVCVFMFGCSNKDNLQKNDTMLSLTVAPTVTSTPTVTLTPEATSTPEATLSPEATLTPEVTPTLTPTPMPTSVPRDELTILDTKPIPEISEQVLSGKLYIEGNTFTLWEYMHKDNDPVGEIIYLDSHTYSIGSTKNITFGITNWDTQDENALFLNYDIVSYEDFLAYYPGLTAWGVDCYIWSDDDTIVRILAGPLGAAG